MNGHVGGPGGRDDGGGGVAGLNGSPGGMDSGERGVGGLKGKLGGPGGRDDGGGGIGGVNGKVGDTGEMDIGCGGVGGVKGHVGGPGGSDDGGGGGVCGGENCFLFRLNFLPFLLCAAAAGLDTDGELCGVDSKPSSRISLPSLERVTVETILSCRLRVP